MNMDWKLSFWNRRLNAYLSSAQRWAAGVGTCWRPSSHLFPTRIRGTSRPSPCTSSSSSQPCTPDSCQLAEISAAYLRNRVFLDPHWLQCGSGSLMRLQIRIWIQGAKPIRINADPDQVLHFWLISFVKHNDCTTCNMVQCVTNSFSLRASGIKNV
jgi:hypothetical protein